MSPRVGLDSKQVLEVAADLANQEGYEAVTLANVAKKLQIRTPSLYNHIDGLPDLRQKLAIYGIEKMYNQMVQAVIGKSRDEAVRDLAQAYVDFAKQHPGLYEASFRAPDPLASDFQHAGDAVVQLILQVFQGYQLEGDRALHMVRSLRSMLHGFVSLSSIGGFGLPLDLSETFDCMMQTFLKGLTDHF